MLLIIFNKTIKMESKKKNEWKIKFGHKKK